MRSVAGLVIVAVAFVACDDDSGSGGGSATASSSSQQATGTASSSSTGDYTQCAGLACGAPCSECFGFGCWEAFCHADGLCSSTPPPCAKKTLCYQIPANETSCAGADAAGSRLCESCAVEGCIFYGQFLGAAEMSNGSCCYEIAGGCKPPPPP